MDTDILLVEDNPRDAEMTLRALRRHHLTNQLVWVHDGAEALDRIFGPEAGSGGPLLTVPRLILLDLKLPRVDGHEVLRRLKTDPRSQGIPVVVLTSSNEESDMLRACALGTNSFLVKPVDFDAFVEAVRQLGMYWLLLNQSPSAAHLAPVSTHG